MAAWQRNPLSARYDAYARRLLLAAIRSRAERGRGVKAFIVSPAAEFRDLDSGGRTVHERELQRSLYYPVQQIPRQIARARGLGREGAVYDWSLKLRWGKIENRGGRWGRTLTVRVYRYSAGRRHVARHPDTAYTAHEELQSRAAPQRAG